MFKRIWRWLVRSFRGLLNLGRSRNIKPLPIQQEVPSPLSNADLEFMFTQLLAGVHQQRGQGWALKYLQNIEHRITTDQWVEWLQRFGERLLASPTPNEELAARMVQLGELRIGKVGDIAYAIAMQLLQRNSGKLVREHNGSDVKLIAPSNQEGENNQKAQVLTTDNSDTGFNQGSGQYEAENFDDDLADDLAGFIRRHC